MTDASLPPRKSAELSDHQELGALLYFLRCSLSYQNQLLAEIKTLLEQLTIAQPAGQQKNSG